MLKESEFVKIRVFVPVLEATKVRESMAEAGAGVQGNYAHCSASYEVKGRFMPLEGASPAIGQIGVLETVQEEVIEMLCHKDLINKVVLAIKENHPYEEPAIDVIPRLEF